MIYPNIGVQLPRSSNQALQLRGINLTDNYADGQLESSNNIGTSRFPYISTVDRMEEVQTGITDGYHAVSMFGWEELFVVSSEPNADGTGYKCYYGGTYCGDVKSLEPKQYAVVNSKLCVFPDRVMFNLYEGKITAQNMTNAPVLRLINSGTVDYRRASEFGGNN